MTNDTETSRMTDGGAPEPKTVKIAPRPTKAQIRSLVDVLEADVRRAFDFKPKPADVELFRRVAERAVKLAIELRGYTTEAELQAVIEDFETRRLQINSQLAAIKSIGSSIAARRFWKLVQDVIDRLATFAVTSVAAAL